MASICLDVDGVITDICAGLNYELEIKRSMFNFDYSDWLIGSKEDSISKQIFGSKLFWKNLKAFDDAWYQVNHWWSMGFDIHLVTSRFDNAGREVLPLWLDWWRIQYSSFHFALPNQKIDVVKSLDPIFFVDDNPFEVKNVSEIGIQSYLKRGWYNSEFWEEYDSLGSLMEIEV
jgi:hypothetical protein